MIDQTHLAIVSDSDPEPDADFHLIIDYLNDELPPEERDAARERLASDESFYRRMKRIRLVLSLAGPVATQGSSEKTGRTLRWVHLKRLGQLAAAVMVLATVGAGFTYGISHLESIEAPYDAWHLAHIGETANTGTTWTIRVPGSSEVTLEPGSHARSEVFGSTESRVWLEGAATVSVTDATGEIAVVTAGGDALFMPGEYRVAMEDSNTMWVLVRRGLARVRGRQAGSAWITLGAGGHVRVRR